MIDIRHVSDDFESVQKAFSRYKALGWNPTMLDKIIGKKAPMTAPFEDCTLAVRANGLAIVSVPTDALPNALLRPEFVKCPLFENGSTATASFIFKTCGAVEGNVGELHVKSWSELVVGFESFEEFIALPPEQGLIWLRAPGRKSFLPSLPLAMSMKIEA